MILSGLTPALPTRFYGTAAVAGSPAPPGAEIEGSIGNKPCGIGTVSNDGEYWVDVAGTEGDTVAFTIDGAKAAESGTFHMGAFVRQDLTAKSKPT